MKKERTEMDNAALPPLLQDEVKHDRRRMVGSSVSSGRDSIIGSRVTTFISSNKDLLLGLMTGLVIVLGVLLFFAYRDKKTSEDLKNYDLTQFQAGDFAAFRSKTEGEIIGIKATIEAYGLQRTVVDNCKRK